MTEIQQSTSQPEVLDAAPTLHELQSEWTAGASEKLKGQLRQARAGASLERHYGKGSVASFAKDMGVSESLVYEYAAAWRKLKLAFPSEEEIYSRLEDSPLRIWQIIEASRDEPPSIPQALDDAEDENRSVPKIRKNREDRGKPKNVEVITEFVCPSCGEISPMSSVETRTTEVHPLTEATIRTERV